MAYIPPHRRQSECSDRPSSSSTIASSVPTYQSSSTSDSIDKPHFKPQISDHQHSFGSRHGNRFQSIRRITYATQSISRWFLYGDAASTNIPYELRLEPFACEPFERKAGTKAFVLAAGSDDAVLDHVVEEPPWKSIAERVAPDLVLSASSARAGIGLETGAIRLSFVARVGKVLFNGGTSDYLETIKKVASAGTDSRNQLHKSFYTNVPDAYKENIEHGVVPKIGFDFNLEKEYYEIKMFDKFRPESTMSCKCKAVKDSGELQVHKIELNQVRHLVVDISCLYKDLDLRLMLLTKQLLGATKDEEMDWISKLVKSAVIDPDVKGGLRWPLGKDSVADRYNVIGVWHTRFKTFKCGTMRLKLRNANRYDCKSSTGEVSTEVTMNLTGISKLLRNGDIDAGQLKLMIQEAVKVMWMDFLNLDFTANSC